MEIKVGAVGTSLLVFIAVFGSALLGMGLRKLLPEHHRTSATQDTVKLAMGFVATMAALILGLLVASAKESFDKESSGVTEMAAKIVYLDRMLANYGPETKDIRAAFKHAVEQINLRMWPDKNSGDAVLDPTATRAESLYLAIQSLSPKTELQTALKTQALSTSLEIGQLRWLEFEQSDTSISGPMLYILTFWVSILFLSFGMYSPVNMTVVVALMLAALSVAGAILVTLDLGSPFSGLMQISNAPFVDAIAHLGK